MHSFVGVAVTETDFYFMVRVVVNRQVQSELFVFRNSIKTAILHHNSNDITQLNIVALAISLFYIAIEYTRYRNRPESNDLEYPRNE